MTMCVFPNFSPVLSIFKKKLKKFGNFDFLAIFEIFDNFELWSFIMGVIPILSEL